MTKRFEAFKEEYEALCKKYNAHIDCWFDRSLGVYDLGKCHNSYMDLDDCTSETDDLLEINDKTKET